jgi:hypothetical protein
MSAKNRILIKIKRNHTAWCRAIIDLLDKVLGAFRKTMKSDYYLRHVCPSVCLSAWNNRRHRTDFHGIWYLNIFRNHVEKIQVSLKPDKNNGTLLEDRHTFCDISRSVLLRRKNISYKIYKENQNTHFVLNKFLWDNVEKYCRAGDATDDNMAHAHCMLDA